jgi:imidazoleglycerol-phosphate dehydratase
MRMQLNSEEKKGAMNDESQLYGMRIEQTGKTLVSVVRITTESDIRVTVSRERDKPARIDTNVPFLTHMVETLSWRAGIAIDAGVKTAYESEHVVCEDLGAALGAALYRLCAENLRDGINGCGSAVAVLDEALARAVISIEGRGDLYISNPYESLEWVDGMSTSNLEEFLRALARAMNATIHIDLLKGKNPHHIWEAAFRASGEALKIAFMQNEWRKGRIAGLKGTLD